jgi:integrase
MTEQPIHRQRRKTLSDRQVAALPRKRKRYTVSDPEMRGHFVRVPPIGPSTFVAVCRDQYGKQVWVTLGAADVLKIEQAREKARLVIGRVKEGKPPVEPPPVRPDSFQVVAENWLKRHVAKKGLRSQSDIERILQKYVLPHWGSRPFADIQRSDVAKLLDHIEDNHGSRMADIVLAYIRSVANWHTTRNDTYTSPVVRGMCRDKADPRDRILDDDELRAVWKAAETGGTFGALVRVLLCTGQRREKVTTMKFDAVDLGTGVWVIATEKREKGNAGALRLPEQALAIVRAQPRLGNNPHVFASLRGAGPINGISKAKAAFDKSCGVTGWTLHDLRRTARSLMSRAKVLSEHAERVMGHAIGGVEGIYDRFEYFNEKADALNKLAALIERTVNPPDANVVPLHPAVQP